MGVPLWTHFIGRASANAQRFHHQAPLKALHLRGVLDAHRGLFALLGRIERRAPLVGRAGERRLLHRAFARRVNGVFSRHAFRQFRFWNRNRRRVDEIRIRRSVRGARHSPRRVRRSEARLACAPMGVPRGLNTLPPGAAVGDPVELKRAFQDQLRRELGARAGASHSTLGDRRVARAASRKMTAAGAPGAQYILDGDVRARQTLEPALGLPQLTAVKLATFADDVESRVGREKQSADWAASADAASGAPGLTKPDVKLGAGGSGGGARAVRFRKAVYGAPRDAAPGASARERAAADPPGFRTARGTTTIAFPGGDAFIRSHGAPARGGRFRARPASGARGKHKPRVSRAWNREPALSGAPTPTNNRAATEAAAPPADHFPTSASAVAADAPWPKPITPDAPPEKKRVPASLLSGRSRARGRAAPRPPRLAAGQPDALVSTRRRRRRERRGSTRVGASSSRWAHRDHPSVKGKRPSVCSGARE